MNDTLELAKEANARASQTMKLKAEQSLADIDAQAEELVERAVLSDDFKKMVIEPLLRSEFTQVATELQSIEGYLQLQGVDLTANCLFVKGMHRHLLQDPRVAVRSLRSAAQQKTRSRELAALAQYWTGYELNNLGRYRQASQVFRSAEADVESDSPKSFELRRIYIETQFFEAAEQWESARTLRLPLVERSIDSLRKLLARLDEFKSDRAYGSVTRACNSTIANVLVWAAGPGPYWRDNKESETYNRECLKEACAFYALGSGNWSRFGLLEAKHQLDIDVAADVTRYEEIAQFLEEQLRERVEHRSLANLMKARMIVQVRQGKSIEEVGRTYENMQLALSQVDRAITVFSQFEKRNLKWEQFAEEARAFYLAGIDTLAPAPARPSPRSE